MGMPAFDQITLFHVILLVPDVIAATAIIEAAVVVTIEVAVAVIIVHTIPKGAVLMANTTEATPGGGPIPVTHHDHPDNTTANHDLTEDIDLAPTAEANLDPQEEGTAIAPILQIANVPSVPQSLPEENDIEQIKAVECSHRSSKPSHKASYRSSCQNCYVVKILC